MIYTFEGKRPDIGHGTYVHPSADIIGNVGIGADCWIGPGARIRGDYGRIDIGNNTSIEDNCTIHARPGEHAGIADWVTVGHGAIVHNATINDWAIIGMGSVVSDWAKVGQWAVVGEASLIKQHQDVPDYSIAVGVPAHLLDKKISNEFKEQWTCFKRTYVDLAWRYPTGLTPAGSASSG